MSGESFTYPEFLDSIDTTEYNFLDYEPFQIDYGYEKLRIIAYMPPGQREIIGVRSRGGAKTWEEMVFDLYLAQLRNPYVLIPSILNTLPWEAPLRGYWFSTSDDQLDQPKEYFDYIIDNSFLRFIIKKKTNTLVRFKHGGKLKLTILTEKKVRSGRGDFITIDEEAQAEEKLYNAAIGIISGSMFGFLSHISTPCKATIFEKNHTRLRTREYTTEQQLIFVKPWWEIAFLEKNRAFYEEEKHTKPQWWYEQEYCGKFTSPLGSVFRNVVYDVYDNINGEWVLKIPLILDRRIVSGLDWNPVSGHWLSGGQWTEDMRGFLVTHSDVIAVGYTHELQLKNYLQIRQWAIHGKYLCIEDGGFNLGFVKWFKEWFGKDMSKRDINIFYEEWDNQGVAKTNAALEFLPVTIYVDRIRFPELAEQIENQQWVNETHKLELKKDPIDSP
ncbi:hypothetical protein LCGC14_2456490, partial [marine sediment metagenome]